MLVTVPAADVVAVRPAPDMIAHLRLLLLHLLLKPHARHLIRHSLLWRVGTVHGRGGHLQGDALLAWRHKAVWGWGHRHAWEGHLGSGEHARHALHWVHCTRHGQSRRHGLHWLAPWAYHIWHPLQEL